jgi:DNA-binding NarL/FixJ family response regulator
MRLIVADDSVILRQGLVRLLEDAGFAVVGQTGEVGQLLTLVRTQRPEVAIVDIRMPPTYTDEGLRAACQIQDQYPAVGVLILSHHIETGTAVRIMSRESRGFGYLLKDRIAHLYELTEAITRVAGGGSVIDPEVVDRLLNRSRLASPLDELTERERTVLALMAEGRSNDAIAQRLGVGAKTVETHVRNVFTKLGLEPRHADHRRVLAVLTYLQA